MKRIIILCAALISVLKLNAQTKEDKEIIFFSGTWSQALAKAEKEKKLIFLDAYASWCGPCKMMKNSTFKDPKVAEYYNENFINIKMDMEHGEGTVLAEKYHVMSYPTLIFIKHNGDQIFKAVGYHKADEFINVGKYAIKRKN